MPNHEFVGLTQVGRWQVHESLFELTLVHIGAGAQPIREGIMSRALMAPDCSNVTHPMVRSTEHLFMQALRRCGYTDATGYTN